MTVEHNLTDRIVYFDLLRIMAAFCVVLIHVSSQNWKEADIHSTEFIVRTIYNSFARWAVPVFVMISGALFLGKDRSVRRIDKNNILPLVTAFLFWAVLYAVLPFTTTRQTKSTIESIIGGEYHMWFVFMIIGLYMIVPFLRLFIKNEKLTYYFLVLALIFTFLAPMVITVMDMKFSGIAYFLNEDIRYLNLHMVLGYTGYFILGHVLHTRQLSKKVRLFIYLLGILGLAFTVVATVFVSRRVNKASQFFFDYLSPNVLVMSCAVFCFAKVHLNAITKEKTVKLLNRLSKATLGVYLVHVLVIDVLRCYLGLNTLSFNVVISVPALALLVYIVSFLISSILNKIPIINKYLV